MTAVAHMACGSDSLSLSLERVLERFGGVMRRVCWKYQLRGADVDELMQEVRIRLWHAHAGHERASESLAAIPASYLQRTALSAAIDLMRRGRARRADRMVPIDDEPDGMGQSAAPDQVLAESEAAEQVERSVLSIHASRRAVVRMYLIGHSREEIAQLLGWTEAKTRNLLYRGLADLRERLMAEGDHWKTPNGATARVEASTRRRLSVGGAGCGPEPCGPSYAA
jgi:RNA polymerase sigma factor (sigma-70 family)